MKNLSVIKTIEDIKDFDEIIEIENKAFIDPYTKDLYLIDFISHPYSKYFKLVLNHKIIGYIGLWIIFDDAQITTLAIDPNLQGLGYSKVIMDFVINYLKERNCQQVTLEVRITNEIAISLYEKYHFLKVAKRKRYYEDGEDAYLMKLDLGH